MLFCVFLLCEGQNIVLICFAGSRLKTDSMLVLYHFSISTVRWFRPCKYVPNSWFLCHFWCIPPPAMMTVTADPRASLGHSCGCPSPWQKQLQALLGCVCPSQADEELRSLRGQEVLLPSSPVPSLPSTGTRRQLWALSQPDTGGGVWLFRQRLLLEQLFPISSKEKVAGHMEASCGPDSDDGHQLDRAGLDWNTGMSCLVSAISHSQNDSKLEDRQGRTYLSFWI